MDQDLPAKHTPPTLVTGVVLTNNGERLLEQCLASLSFCSAILVVDSGSLDQTLHIASRHNATILKRSWTGFADQFTFAADAVATPWFFILDQDEVCSPALTLALRAALAQADAALLAEASGQVQVAAFAVPRRSWYFDRFMNHSGWTPDYVPRLFRTGQVHFTQDAHIHYHPHGPLMRIRVPEAVIVHYPYTGFAHQWDKLNLYAQQGAEHLRAKGKPGGIWRGIGHGVMRFLKLYVIKLGFLDGRAGFLAAAHGAFYAFSKYVRTLEASWGKPYDHKP